jgi:hypothetical protein
MTDMPSQSSFTCAIGDNQAVEFAVFRNDYLNAFSALEATLCRLAFKHNCIASENAAVGQRLDAFDKLKPSSQLSSANVEKVKALAADISSALKIRNSIVHGAMTMGEWRGSVCAMFHNATYAATDIPMHLVLNAKDFAASINKVKEFEQGLSRLINPPSSPPQPKQAAATGP